jgi:hypothetical protein
LREVVSSVANKLIGGIGPGMGQRIEQRRLSGIGIADQRNVQQLAAPRALRCTPR